MQTPYGDRPREKLGRLGVAALTDHELVAIVLGHGSRDVSVVDLARAVLASFGGVHGLTRTSIDALRAVRGVGTSRAMQLVAAVELGRRTLQRSPERRAQMLGPRDAAEYLLPRFSAHPVERFGLLLLDARYRIIRTAVVSTGGVDATPVHPREVFREAALAGASALVLFHNHPSGDPTPSADDIRLTARLRQAGELMGIEVADHVILADDRYYSFREAGTFAAPAER
jgi:DNA repair protein RadC